MTPDTFEFSQHAIFPHNQLGTSAAIVFSDGSRLPVTFLKRKVSWFKLTDLQPAVPKGWYAITGIKAWGSR